MRIRMQPRAYIKTVTFSDGTAVEFGPQDLVVVVGPNNSGKTQALQDLRNHFNSPTSGRSLVVQSTEITREGTKEELIEWITVWAVQRAAPSPELATYTGHGWQAQRADIESAWTSASPGLGELASLFCIHIDAGRRLTIAKSPQSVDFQKDPISHPAQLLYRSEKLEERVSTLIRSAFGEDLVINHGGGSRIPIHIGTRPELHSGEDRVSESYVRRVSSLPLLDHQGDGIKCFTGILLVASTSPASTLLIDEPEAFLHPPQARLIARILASDNDMPHQAFIATHSSDVLRGGPRRQASRDTGHPTSTQRRSQLSYSTRRRRNKTLVGRPPP